jgi:hypothetical protein
MSIAEESRYMDTLRQGVSATTYISVSLAEFKQENVGKRQQKTTFSKVFMASQYYQQLTGERRNNVVFLVSRKQHHLFASTVPGFGTAPGRHRIQYREQFASEAQ